MNYYAGVDLGGTNTKIGILNREGDILKSRIIKTLSAEGVDNTLERIWKTIQELAQELDINIKNIKGIGLGIPGPVLEQSIVAFFANFPWERNINIKEKLEKAVGRVEEVNYSINARETGFHCNEGSFPWLKTKILNPLFNRFMTSAKPFYVTDDCIGCKRCERICPVGNVVVIGWRPVWGMDCTSCLACYHVCPKHAVQYGKRTRSKVFIK